MADNNIGPEGAHALMSALATNPSLATLDLSCLPLNKTRSGKATCLHTTTCSVNPKLKLKTDACPEDLLQALSANTVLVSLGFMA